MADKEHDNDGLVLDSEGMTRAMDEDARAFTGPLPSSDAMGEDEVIRAARLARAQTRADIADNRLSTQGLKFIISGGISAIPDLGLTYILQIFFGVGPVLARTVGFIVGTLTAYFINRRWTFKAEPSVKRFFAVALLYALTWGVNVGLHRLGYDFFTGLGLSDGVAIVIAYVIAQGVATVVNFVVQRTLIFKVR